MGLEINIPDEASGSLPKSVCKMRRGLNRFLRCTDTDGQQEEEGSVKARRKRRHEGRNPERLLSWKPRGSLPTRKQSAFAEAADRSSKMPVKHVHRLFNSEAVCDLHESTARGG